MVANEKDYDSPEYTRFKQQVQKLTGLDLNSYKNQIHRRAHMLMSRWNLTDYDQYFTMINKNEDKLRDFLDYLTINVSEFLRNPPRWWDLRDHVIPDLIKTKGSKKLRLWSAGSATGEEPYSLAMLSSECGLSSATPVHARDIDAGAIAIAQRGIYHKRQLVNVPPDWITKYFKVVDEQTYQVKDDLKKRVDFARLNLIEDRFEKDYDLILCRNVVIYFRPETKAVLYQKFFDALRPGGYLLVGSTEQIFEYKSYGFEAAKPFLYRKPLK
ncbi:MULTISPECIES: CheR family methyltransferase [Dethiosulfovibrio]|uniref:protein-glutamate O-methyltransferase n=2 Tax=Dethiosulfovibrio TaxID=47054 RepID=A0ABS9ELT9_9BACT|nr:MULTISPECIES: protein-glutamate O-methyltransferase CheR [Dethiosulfovibrio]MCF4113689.1 protein-glutamate O-methyltransferase CheR [Dethiosulfovibrio russensis]MCF4142159.1 protein-glutamate O-methyltransferase CheR [Dethiosulfovibrio marinus]MCF4144314.1 protein-glutamate O-methyltransferase CheR [Dethiosulfovibrio acidaminovorans]